MHRDASPHASIVPTREASVQVARQRVSGACRQRRPAVHSHAVAVFYVEGGATIEQSSSSPALQRQAWRLSAGDVMLLPAGMPHRLLDATESVRWGLGFCMPCYAADLGALYTPFERARAGGAAVITVGAERRARLEGLLGELELSIARRDRAGDLVQRSLLALVLDELGRASPPLGEARGAAGGKDSASSAGRLAASHALRAPRSSHRPAATASTERIDDLESPASSPALAPVRQERSLIADSLRFIERHCLAPLSLTDIATAVGKSPAYLTTALRRATGRSAVQWVIAGRLAEARRRLATSSEPIDRIAERIGYADATHFIRLFRREHGLTPAAWRAQHRRPDF